MTGYVYRCFNDAGDLLYVGFTINPARRMKQHKTGSVWFPIVAKTTIAEFPTRELALAEERRAIYSERPRCNLRSNEASDADLLHSLHQRRLGPKPSLRVVVPDWLADAIEKIEAVRTSRAELKAEEAGIFAEAQARGVTARGLKRALAAKSIVGEITDQQLMQAYRGQQWAETTCARWKPTGRSVTRLSA